MAYTFPLILVPAYGRTYQAMEGALEDWEAGKDFRIEGGPYCSIRDIEPLRKMNANISIRIKPGLYEAI